VAVSAAVGIALGIGIGQGVPNVLGFGLVAMPLAIGIGVLKYRLYDIDRIISPTPWTWTRSGRIWPAWCVGF
jgi:hypothetical protein